MHALKLMTTERRTIELQRDECVAFVHSRGASPDERRKALAKMLRMRSKMPVSTDPLIDLREIRDSGDA